jgi:hypothetical protein
MDELRRAGAILGVPQGATPEQLRTRYRELVKQWHPDRYASDPQGQAEAEARMREINVAFDLLLAASAVPRSYEPAGPGSAPPVPQAPIPGQRLTREQIERMVASIGSPNPLDDLIRGIPESRLAGLSNVALVALVAILGWVALWSFLSWLGLGDALAGAISLTVMIFVGMRLRKTFARMEASSKKP